MQGVVTLALLALGLCADRPLAAGTILVQPINLCNSGNTVCGDPSEELYSSVTNKIWSQAGLSVSFLPWTVSSAANAYLNIDLDSEFYNLDWSSTTWNGSVTVSMWFVPSITWCGSLLSGTVYGCSEMGGNTAVISSSVFADSRLDTIAHELGHILGLDHCDSSPTPEDVLNHPYACSSPLAHDLMTSGSSRMTPSSIGNVTPDGLGLDRLSADEIRIADSSYHVLADNSPVPEPSGISLALAGVGALLLRARASKRKV
jgi:hypothetical protein